MHKIKEKRVPSPMNLTSGNIMFLEDVQHFAALPDSSTVGWLAEV